MSRPGLRAFGLASPRLNRAEPRLYGSRRPRFLIRYVKFACPLWDTEDPNITFCKFLITIRLQFPPDNRPR